MQILHKSDPVSQKRLISVFLAFDQGIASKKAPKTCIKSDPVSHFRRFSMNFFVDICAKRPRKRGDVCQTLDIPKLLLIILLGVFAKLYGIS